MAIRVYLAGPMSGLVDHNFPAFTNATARLRQSGFSVISPAEMSGLPENSHLTWQDHMHRDIRLVLECDTIALLPGWEKSKGARLEVFVAACLGKGFIEAETGLSIQSEKILVKWLTEVTFWVTDFALEAIKASDK